MKSEKKHRFSKVSRRIWRDEKVRRLSPPQPCGRSLWIWLLTCAEQLPIPGMIPMGEAAMAEALEWPLEGFREAFREVLREGLAEVDRDARLVWLPNGIKHNEPESPNVILSWRLHWDEAPECRLKGKAYSRLEAWAKAKGEPWLEAFGKAIAKPSGNQEQEQEQEQEQDPPNPSGGDRFELTPPEQTKPTDDAIDRIWTALVDGLKARGKGTPKLNQTRRRHIRARLRDFDEPTLLRAAEIFTCEASWWMANNRHQPELVFRSVEQLEKILARADEYGLGAEASRPRSPRPTDEELEARRAAIAAAQSDRPTAGPPPAPKSPEQARAELDRLMALHDDLEAQLGPLERPLTGGAS